MLLISLQGLCSYYSEHIWSHVKSLQETVCLIYTTHTLKFTCFYHPLIPNYLCINLSWDFVCVCGCVWIMLSQSPSIFFHWKLIKETYYPVRILSILKLLTSCLSQISIDLQFAFFNGAVRRTFITIVFHLIFHWYLHLLYQQLYM